MLGRSTRDSGPLTRSAATQAGWQRDDLDLLDLGTTSATLSTVGSIRGLGAVVHIGHPAQPDPDLERTLLQSPVGVLLTAAVTVPSQWVWVGTRATAGAHTVVDEAGMRDCRHRLRAMGVHPQLVPTSTEMADRVALAGVDGALVVERSRVPAGFVELAGSETLSGEKIWYALATAPQTAALSSPSQVWLAFGPTDDHRGSLQSMLDIIASAGFDLQHLRSQSANDGPHVFFCAFVCDSQTALSALLLEFGKRGVRHRTLALLPVIDTVLGPDAVEPRWDRD